MKNLSESLEKEEKKLEKEEIKYEILGNTNFFRIKNKYKALRKNSENYNISSIYLGKNEFIHLLNIYWIAEPELSYIQCYKGGLEEYEDIIIEKEKDNNEIHIESELKKLKIKMSSVEYIISEIKNIIYRIYNYRPLGIPIDLFSELYQLLPTVYEEAITINEKLLFIDFDRITDGKLCRHFIKDWQDNISCQVEYIQIQIMNIFGMEIQQGTLSSYYQKDLNEDETFFHLINNDNYWIKNY